MCTKCANTKAKGDHEVNIRVALHCLLYRLFNFNPGFYWILRTLR